MLPADTINTIKFSLAGIAAAISIVKAIRIIRFNNKSDEPLPLNLFGFFSAMDIDGSYQAERKKLMADCNRMSLLIYMVILLFILVHLYPYFMRKMGIE
ncbi:MAG TPA: hypothetical protein VLC98_03870 [Phnomibacter sp.]|nr:hypothetical protein [Phnomibacter sp.]